MTSFASQRPWVLTVLMRKREMWSGWRIKWFAQLRLGCFICGLAIFLLFIISLLCSRSFSHEVNFNCRVFRQEPIFDRMICVFPLVCKMVNGKLTDRGQTRENEKGARTEICPALTSGNLNGDAPVSSYLFTSSTGRIGVRTALKYGTKPIGYMTLHVRDRRGAAWLSQKSRRHNLYSVCVNRSPTRYGFRAGAKAIRYSMNIYSICDSPVSRSARCSVALLQKSRRNHRSCVWTEALSIMVFAPAQRLSDIVSTWVLTFTGLKFNVLRIQ